MTVSTRGGMRVASGAGFGFSFLIGIRVVDVGAFFLVLSPFAAARLRPAAVSLTCADARAAPAVKRTLNTKIPTDPTRIRYASIWSPSNCNRCMGLTEVTGHAVRQPLRGMRQDSPTTATNRSDLQRLMTVARA